jgi:7-carboxy-7-deazaguanine synthase
MKQKYIYKIKEIFLTKQGEGYHTGRPSVFLRFSGCNLWSGLEKDRVQAICNWCDTDFVGINGVNGGNYDIKEILDIISNLWPSDSNSEPFLVCTGGEPLLQLDQNFVDEIHKIGFKISIETNGTKLPPNEIDWICVSPKKEPIQFENYEFKHFFIQPMDNNDYEKNKKLSETFVEQNPKWKLSLQTHKILGFP